MERRLCMSVRRHGFAVRGVGRLIIGGRGVMSIDRRREALLREMARAGSAEELNTGIIARLLAVCEHQRDSTNENYNIGYNNALKLIKFEIKEFRDREADREFVKETAHPDRNLKAEDFLAECNKFMKKEYEIYFDELGTMKVIRMKDGFVCWTDRCMKAEIDKAMMIIWNYPE